MTIVLSTRGSPFGSRAYHQAGYGNLLEPQLADHAAAVRQLVAQETFIDENRVGIIGMSGGGAAAARALCDYSDIFKVGVAACGNHDSSLYSASWSDKYRGPPDHAAWKGQSNAEAAGRLRGKLLLITGDLDDNVHPGHTLKFADALIKANRNFELLVLPNVGHDVFGSPYAIRRSWDYLVRNLLGIEPPAEFELRFEPHELAAHRRLIAREARL